MLTYLQHKASSETRVTGWKRTQSTQISQQIIESPSYWLGKGVCQTGKKLIYTLTHVLYTFI